MTWRQLAFYHNKILKKKRISKNHLSFQKRNYSKTRLIQKLRGRCHYVRIKWALQKKTPRALVVLI